MADLARRDGVPELREFAPDVHQDQAVVAAAWNCEWSSGETNIQITQLTCGRERCVDPVNSGLLKHRVLAGV